MVTDERRESTCAPEIAPAPQVVVTLTENGRTIRIGSVSVDEPTGSLSSDEPGGRRLFTFGWFEGQVGVFESLLGSDVENDAVRMTSSLALVRLSDLSEPFELTIYRNGLPRHLTFTQE